MSEEIIIDGVNVAECKYYEDMHECPDNLNGGYYVQHCYCDLQGDNYCICNKNHNCYFKQLQRLKQENEELKADLKAETEQAHKWYQRETDKHFVAIKYKQALEEIREITKKYDAEVGDTIIANPIQDCYDVFIKVNEVLND